VALDKTGGDKQCKTSRKHGRGGRASSELQPPGRQHHGVGITNTDVRSLTVGGLLMKGRGVALDETAFLAENAMVGL
jgi:hypothetical protein